MTGYATDEKSRRALVRLNQTIDRVLTGMKYSPGQPRDSFGRFGSTGSGGDLSERATNARTKLVAMGREQRALGKERKEAFNNWQATRKAKGLDDPETKAAYRHYMDVTQNPLSDDKTALAEAQKVLEVEDPIKVEFDLASNVTTGAPIVASKELSRYVSNPAMSGKPVSVVARVGRSSYTAENDTIHLDTKDHRGVAVIHEYGHAIEARDPAVSREAHRFLNERTRGEKPKRLAGEGYRPDEVALPDKFVDPYVGKVYSSGATEVISVGLERYIRDPIGFAKSDPEHFELIYKAVRGFK